MSQNKKCDKKELKAANERRLNELININNKYVRTQRHLEEYAEITEPDQLKHVINVQRERQHRMENLKDIITYGKHNKEDEVENIKRNLEFTDNYLDNNASHMDEITLENTIEKQINRKEQLKSLD